MADSVKPWTIKGVPDEERNAAIAAANRGKTRIGAWIAQAIRDKIKTDINQERSVAIVTEQISTPYNGTRTVLAPQPAVTLESIVEIALRAGDPGIDPAVKKLVNLTLRDQVRELRRARRSENHAAGTSPDTDQH